MTGVEWFAVVAGCLWIVAVGMLPLAVVIGRRWGRGRQ